MKIKKTHLLLIATVGILISAYAVYNYIYQEHRDIATEKVGFTMSANKLSNTMQTSDSSKILIDKVIQTHGIITSVEQNSVTLNTMVQVNFNQDYTNKLLEASTITIKGRCVGYDDLLELVKIDQATIINNQINK